jgi:uncharacterized membrane protein (GlpM family)
MTVLRRFRALYGAGPLHLLALLASFAVVAAAIVGWFQRPGDVRAVLVWFVAAIVLHDLVLLPLYSLLDRVAFDRVAFGRRRRVRSEALPQRISPTPYIRIPAILSGLLFAVFFPVIVGFGAETELSASGITESGYLARWLLVTGILFALSGIAYAVALVRAGAMAESGDGAPDQEESHPEEEASHPEEEALHPDHAAAAPEPARAVEPAVVVPLPEPEPPPEPEPEPEPQSEAETPPPDTPAAPDSD